MAAVSKKQYPEDFKTLFGVSTMGLSQVISYSLVTTILMLYLTDYAGLYAGVAGKAAAVVGVMLLVCRLWDAVSGPILGFVMDRSPRRRWGKFKPFMFWGTIASAVFIMLLFNIPAGLADTTRIAMIYGVYFVFTIAFNLLPISPLVQSLSKDDAVRTKLLTGLRIFTVVAAITLAFFIMAATALGGKGGVPRFGLTVVLYVIPFTLISLLGVLFVKEGGSNRDEERVRYRDVPAMFKANKPVVIFSLAVLTNGFVGIILFGYIYYYIKYALGPENFSLNSMIIGAIMLVGNIGGVFLSQPIQKRFTAGVSLLICNTISIVPLAVLWALNLTGPVRSPALLYSLLLISILGLGMSFIPLNLMTMECMDYNKYKLGKSMEGTVSAIAPFINKLQVAVTSAIVGAVLASAGYNPEKYTTSANVPAALFSGLGFSLFTLPVLFGLLSNIVMLFYPLLKKAKRNEVYAEIERAKIGQATDPN